MSLDLLNALIKKYDENKLSFDNPVDILLISKLLELLISNKEHLDSLLRWMDDNNIQIAKYVSWYGTYKGDNRPDGSDGCISYEQTFLKALEKAKYLQEINEALS